MLTRCHSRISGRAARFHGRRSTGKVCGTALVRVVAVATIAASIAGCDDSPQPAAPPTTPEPTVQVVHPMRRTITHTIGQPGEIQPYQQTALYAKIAGFVKEWKVDIGDHVKAGELLATIEVPELVERYDEQAALVKESAAKVLHAEKLVTEAENDVKTAGADVSTSQAQVGRYQAAVDRWQSETSRMNRLLADKVIDPQILQESIEQLRENESARDAARSQVTSRESQRAAAAAALDAAIVAVDASKSQLESSQAAERRLKALLGYTRINAPYDAVVTARNINKGDLVTPATGDPTQAFDSLGVSPARAVPLYVVSQIDPVMFVVGVPEDAAGYVKAGMPATIAVQALGNIEITAPVTRTSWYIAPGSRTLEAEIDLANADGKLMPGMYAYGKLKIEQRDVWALPSSSIFKFGNELCCYVVRDERAVLTPVQIGLSDGEWTEVRQMKTAGASSDAAAWSAPTGVETVVTGDLTDVVNGMPVRMAAPQPHSDSG